MKNSLIVGICGLLLTVLTGCSDRSSSGAVLRFFNGQEITSIGDYTYIVRDESNNVFIVRCMGTMAPHEYDKKYFMENNVAPLFSDDAGRFWKVKHYPID